MATVREKRSLVPWRAAKPRAVKRSRPHSAHRFGPRLPFARRYLLQVWVTSLPLLVADQCALAVALLVQGLVQPIEASFSAICVGLSLSLWVANYGLGLYPGTGLSPAAELRRTTFASCILFGVFLAGTSIHDVSRAPTARLLVGTWLILLVAMPAFRKLARTQAAKFAWWGQPVMIFGGGIDGASAYRALLAAPQQGLRPVGIVDELHRQWSDCEVDPAWYLGTPKAAARLAKKHGVFWGIVSMSQCSRAEVAKMIDRYACTIPHLLVVPDFGHPQRSWRGAHDFGNQSGIRIDERLLLPLPRMAKRVMDLVLTVLGGIAILPLILGIACAIRFSSPGPVFYSQERIGRGGRRFRAWKFRSMVVDAEKALDDYLARHPELKEEWVDYQKLKRDPRVTAVGRFLRKTSLDELPQLWNVLKGEMSLVGPRPIVQSEIVKYGSAYRLYQRVVPGITGLWQVSGRNNTTYQQRVEFDMRYVRNWSLWFDMQILFATIDVVVRRQGAY